MKRIMLAAAMAAVMTMQLGATTVARALVTGYHNSIYRYDIDENGEWSNETKFIDKANCGSMAMHAVVKNGKVYVSVQVDEISSDACTGYVKVFNLDGTLSETIEVPGCYPEGIAITPDGKTMFVSDLKYAPDGIKANQTGCHVYKYDFATKTWTMFAYVNYTGDGSVMLRDMAIDGNNRLYCASRNKNLLFCFDINTADENLPITYSSSSQSPTGLLAAVSYGFCEGVAWDSAKDEIHVAGNSGQWAIYKWVDDKLTQQTSGTVSGTTGWSTGIGFVNGKRYQGSYQNNKIWRFDYNEETPASSTFTLVKESALGSISSVDFFDPNEFGTPKTSFETANATSVEGVGKTLYPQGGLITGTANGISGNCAYFREATATAKFINSQDMIPTTGDFYLSFWCGLPAQTEGEERILLSNVYDSETNALALVVGAGGGENANQLGVKIGKPTGTETTWTTGAVADGKWHLVALVRRGGTAIELYLDGVKTTIACNAKHTFAQANIWRIGANFFEDSGFLGQGAFIDEFTLTTTAAAIPLDGEILTLYNQHKDAETPTADDLPAAPTAAALDSALGKEIVHSFAYEMSVGAPSFIVASDGTYYVAFSSGEASHAGCQKTIVYQSSDQGANWTKHSELADATVSIFETAGKLHSVGMLTTGTANENMRTFIVRAYDASAKSWSGAQQTYVASEGRMTLMSGQVCIDNNSASRRLWVPFAKRIARHEWKVGNLSFKVQDGAFSDPQYKGDYAVESWHNYNVVDDLTGGVVLQRLMSGQSSGGPHFLYPMPDRHDSHLDSPNVPVGVERVIGGNAKWSGDPALTVEMFRGGSKPFGVVFDSTSQKYYAVTIPVKDHTLLAENDPIDLNTKLSVYVCDEQWLMKWAPAGDIVADSGEGAGFTAATCAIDGNDLVVVTAVATADNSAGTGTSRANYLSFHRVANFRTACVAEAPKDNAVLYLGEWEGGKAHQYWRTSDGEWQPGGRAFCNADASAISADYNDKSYALTKPSLMVMRDNHIYCLQGEDKPARFYEFTLKGKLRKMYIDPSLSAVAKPTGFDISQDESYALLSCGSGSSGGIWKVNLTDNTWSQLVQTSYNARTVQIDDDGTFYVGKWGTSTIHCYQADGTFICELTYGQYGSGLLIDHENHYLYGMGLYGAIYKFDISEGPTSATYTQICGNDIILNGAANNLGLVEGKLYGGSRAGWTRVYPTTPDESGKYPRSTPLATLGSSAGSVLFVPNVNAIGSRPTLLLVR